MKTKDYGDEVEDYEDEDHDYEDYDYKDKGMTAVMKMQIGEDDDLDSHAGHENGTMDTKHNSGKGALVPMQPN